MVLYLGVLNLSVVKKNGLEKRHNNPFFIPPPGRYPINRLHITCMVRFCITCSPHTDRLESRKKVTKKTLNCNLVLLIQNWIRLVQSVRHERQKEKYSRKY